MNIEHANGHGTPVIVIYGAEGRGKTSLAAKFPSPLSCRSKRTATVSSNFSSS